MDTPVDRHPGGRGRRRRAPPRPRVVGGAPLRTVVDPRRRRGGRRAPAGCGRPCVAPARDGGAAATAGLVAFGFLAVGAVWLLVDRAGLGRSGSTTIVLLTAVHFHVAGFVLTVAGALALRSRPSRSVADPRGTGRRDAVDRARLLRPSDRRLARSGARRNGRAGIGIATLRIALTAPGRSGRLALGAAGPHAAGHDADGDRLRDRLHLWRFAGGPSRGWPASTERSTSLAS